MSNTNNSPIDDLKHDMKNELQVIYGNLQLLQDDMSSNEEIALCVKHTKRLIQLVETLK